jgi:FixJ family two-component response regulator
MLPVEDRLKRDYEIYDLNVRGQTYRQIAEKLGGISLDTVSSAIRRVRAERLKNFDVKAERQKIADLLERNIALSDEMAAEGIICRSCGDVMHLSASVKMDAVKTSTAAAAARARVLDAIEPPVQQVKVSISAQDQLALWQSALIVAWQQMLDDGQVIHSPQELIMLEEVSSRALEASTKFVDNIENTVSAA